MRRLAYALIRSGVALAVVLASLAWAKSSPLSAGLVGEILGIPVTLILTGIGMLVTASGGPGAVDAALKRLGEQVRADREAFLRQALGVAWDQGLAEVRFAAPKPGEFSLAIESLLVHWQQLDGLGRMQGTVASIAGFYRGVQADDSAKGRLMITGAPGSGKSVLASKLVVDLLPSPREEAGAGAVRVPVWLSLTGCGIDPKTPPDDLPGVFRAWLGAAISDVYGLPAKLARALVEEDRVLPVLDGLDEIDPALSVAVVNALNQGRREPVILTCRAGDYDSLADGEPVEVRRPVLMGATHITLRPLDPHAIDRFLTDALALKRRAPELRDRWADVIAAVHQRQPIAAVLASPLRLSFAYLAYRDADDPTQLLRLTEETAMAALVKPAITATVNNDPNADRNGWTPPQVLYWLECLAVHQRDHATGSEYDILLPDLWRLGGRFLPRYLLPTSFALVAVVSGALTVVYWSSTALVWSAYAFALGPVALGLAAAAEKGPQSIVQRVVDPRTHAGRVSLKMELKIKLSVWLAFGLGVGLLLHQQLNILYLVSNAEPDVRAFGLGAGLGVGLGVGLAGGLAGGLAAGLAAGLGGEPEGTRNCSHLARQCLAYTLVVGLAGGLAAGLAVGLSFGLGVGPGVGLGVGLAAGLGVWLGVGLGVGNGSTWIRYVIGTTLAARRGVAPHRLASFLDWGLAAGLFRMPGYTLQFRHRDLYQALLTYAATPAIHEGESETNVHETP